MPPYLTHLGGWQSLWPLPVAVALLSLLFYLLARPQEAKRDLLLALAAFSMLGLVTGYLTGFSRTPAVGAVLPAVLSLVAGLAVFMLGKDAAIRAIVCLTVLAFATSLVLGTTWGSAQRQVWEDQRPVEDQRKALAALREQALVEVQIREFRQELGLPAALPDLAPKAKPEE